MTTSKEIFKYLLDIISTKTGESKEKLHLYTTINIDLEIYGDDWDELMWPILERYPIEEHSTFEFKRHMAPEGDLILPFLLELVLTIPKFIIGAIIYPFKKEMGLRIFQKRIFGILEYDEQPLYIADIYNSILKGKWEYAKDSNLELKELIK
ncbi:hypothetical protein [Carboxylicivirga sp. RSCT41]|uniref:hypothetical protein n=1 Tax=Carboxylicivirga agarovorans TaxID=3417570 RepID=UPI003D33B930